MTILASGQVAVSPTDIFEVSGADVFKADKVSVNKVIFFNRDGMVQTTTLYLKKSGGTARELREFKLHEGDGVEYLEHGEMLELDNGDILQAETTTSDAVVFVVLGHRE